MVLAKQKGLRCGTPFWSRTLVGIDIGAWARFQGGKNKLSVAIFPGMLMWKKMPSVNNRSTKYLKEVLAPGGLYQRYHCRNQYACSAHGHHVLLFAKARGIAPAVASDSISIPFNYFAIGQIAD
jgi:hypothetical protein